MSEFFQGIIDVYASFFTMETMTTVLTDPVSWGIIGTLVILEGLLSADNALVLAVMVKHLPKEQQKKALFYGLLGAYVFRFIAIGIGVYLVKFGWIKFLGGLYLLWIAIKFFIDKSKEQDGEEEVNTKPRSFWGTVLAVEIMDIAFSVDSVLAAFGVSDQPWVLFLGGILGVLMMRGVAQVFLKLIEKIPELEITAFVLIAIIGLKMIIGVDDVFGIPFIGYHVNHYVFFTLLIVVFAATFIVHSARKNKHQERKDTV